MSDKAIIEIDCDNNVAMISLAEPPELELVGKEYKAKKSITISIILIEQIRKLMNMPEDELKTLQDEITRKG